MRHLLLTAFVLAASTAQAQSLVPLTTKTHASSSSMVTKLCDRCPAPVVKAEKEGSYKVPVLKDGVQSVAIVEIDGKKKIVRTEAWMGGSPVVYVSNVPEWMVVDTLQADIDLGQDESVEAEVQAVSQQGEPIDFGAKTGAVESNAPQNFDDIPLRLK
jgi:hypothetical protein